MADRVSGGAVAGIGTVATRKLSTNEHQEFVHKLADQLNLEGNTKLWLTVRMDKDDITVTVHAAISDESVSVALDVEPPVALTAALEKLLSANEKDVVRNLKRSVAVSIAAAR